jgi:hypothetical protein
MEYVWIVPVLLLVLSLIGLYVTHTLEWKEGREQDRRNRRRLELAERMPMRLITREYVLSEQNAEVRAALMRRMGVAEWARVLGVRRVSGDDWGTLYSDDDGMFRAVAVLNSTPDPDGSRKEYWLRVPGRRDIQPVRLCNVCGRDLARQQIATPKQAIAWTFGLCEYHYEPELVS